MAVRNTHPSLLNGGIIKLGLLAKNQICPQQL